MRIYEAFHNLIERFAPMDQMTAGQLKTEAATTYGQAKAQWEQITAANAKAIEYNAALADGQQPRQLQKMPLKLAAVGLCEQWYMRYLFAILYVIGVPVINRLIEGGKGDDGDDDDPDDEMKEFEDFKRFKRMRK